MFEVRPRREYGRPLHLNPRLLYDIFTGRRIGIFVEPSKPSLNGYSLVVLASPIWYGRPSPPIKAFIKAFKCPGKLAICLTTSQIVIDYSARLKAVAEAEGDFKVVCSVNLAGGRLSEEPLNMVLRAVERAGEQ